MRLSLTTTLILIVASTLPSIAAPIILQKGDTLVARDGGNRQRDSSAVPAHQGAARLRARVATKYVFGITSQS
jgi:hypothetical protein